MMHIFSVTVTVKSQKCMYYDVGKWGKTMGVGEQKIILHSKHCGTDLVKESGCKPNIDSKTTCLI